MQHEIHSLRAAKEKVSLAKVYSVMRSHGIEIDIQTFSHLWQDEFSANPREVKAAEKARGITLRKKIEKRAAAIRSNEIGRDNPALATALHVASLVQRDMTAAPTAQKIMQERLMKVAKGILKVRGVQNQPQDMEALLREVLTVDASQAFGNGYLANMETLFNSFRDEIDKVASEMEANNSYGAAELRQYSDMMQTAAYDLMFSHKEVQRVIGDVLRRAGLTKVMNINGVQKLVTDWKAVHADGFDFRQTMTDVLQKANFSASEISRLVPFFERRFEELMREKAKKAMSSQLPTLNDKGLDRLARLAALGAFQHSERKMIYDALGVNELTQEQVRAVESLLNAYNSFMSTDMADMAPTFFRTIERHIRNMVEKIQEGQSTKLNAMRKFELFSQFQSASILLNVGNAFIENISSGLAELINTAFVDPKQIWNGAKTFATVFADVVQGGVRQGHEKTNVYDNAVNLEDRSSLEEVKTIRGKLSYTLTFLQRVFLTSMDAAMKSYLWKSMEINGIRAALEAQGLTKQEAYMVINETYHGNRAEIERVAKEMEQKLRDAGIATARGKWRRIAGELAAANLFTEGQVMKDALLHLEAAGKLSKQKADALQVDKDLLHAIREAANSAASKGLGHSGDLWITNLLDRKIIASAAEVRMNNKSNRHNYGDMAGAEAKRWLVGSIFRFRSGALKWAALNFEKSSGLALITTLLVDMGMNKKHALLNKKILAGRLQQLSLLKERGDRDKWVAAYNDFKMDLDAAYSVRQRLSRSAIQPVMTWVLFSYVVLPAIKNILSDMCTDDSAECLQKKMEKIKENGWDNVLTKMMPIAAMNYLNSLVKHTPVKGNYYNFTRTKDPSRNFMESYLGTLVPGSKAQFDHLQAFFKTNIGADPVYDNIRKIAEAKDWNQVQVVVGAFIGRTVNAGGVLRMYDINTRYFKTLEGERVHMKESEYKKQKPLDIWDAMVQQNLTHDMYELYLDKTREGR